MTTVSYEFEFGVGDFVCLAADADQELPTRHHVTALVVEMPMDEDPRAMYVLRSSSLYRTDTTHAQPGEVRAYPSEQELTERARVSTAEREESREAIKRFRELRAQGLSQEEANKKLREERPRLTDEANAVTRTEPTE